MDSFRSIIASPFLSKIVLENVDDRDIESVQAVFPEATVTIGVRSSASEAGSGSTTATTAKKTAVDVENDHLPPGRCPGVALG